MLLFEIVVILLLGGAGLAAVARRIGAPYPALVALAGTALALTPSTPVVQLDPELALALFVAPVLLDSAFDASLRDLRANWRPVASLAIGAVGLTVAAVAFVAKWLVPDMSWPVAVALGAIVAPPDAAAATAVLKQLRPPHRLLVILEGESLFNDVSALLIYRLAVGAALGATAVGWPVIPMLLAVTAGSVLLGYAAARATLRVNIRIDDVATAVIVQFCSTFAIWILAERLHLSSILTTVTYAMVASRSASDLIPARIRIPSYAVWEVAVFVLNVLAFILVGLQLRAIVGNLDREEWLAYSWVAFWVCVTSVFARIVWVTSASAVSAWWCRRLSTSSRQRKDSVALSPGSAALVGWCGMRGIVTLATALALPNGDGGGAAFPYRDLILFTAFAVVLVTLVVQGLTVRPLMNILKLEDDGAVEREVRSARVAALYAARKAAAASETEAAELLRRRYDLQLRWAKADVALSDGDAANIDPQRRKTLAPPSADDLNLVASAIAAEREQLSALRASGEIGDAAFQRVEQELDWRELDMQQFLRRP